MSCRFNPTLVRLRLGSGIGSIGISVLFQSHAGSIEALGGTGIAVGPQKWFQSHAGSIEAIDVRPYPATLVGVSIPRWFD